MSGPASFLSAARIIRDANVDAGKLNRGLEPDSDMLADGMNRLNELCNLWCTQGLRLWLQFDLPVPLVAGQNPYTLGPGGSVNMTKPLRVLDSCYYLNKFNTRIPLIPLSRDEYTRLSQTIQQGPINSYFVDKQQLQLVIWFWLVPDTQAATGVAHLLIEQQVTQLVSTTDNIYFPLEWAMALHWGLSDQLSTGQPQAVQGRCEKMAAMTFDALNNFDVEDASTLFQPDMRSFQNVGRFK